MLVIGAICAISPNSKCCIQPGVPQRRLRCAEIFDPDAAKSAERSKALKNATDSRGDGNGRSQSQKTPRRTERNGGRSVAHGSICIPQSRRRPHGEVRSTALWGE